MRPVLNPVLTDFCKQLTTIEQVDVDSAGTYVRVKGELDAWLAQYKVDGLMWCSWGDYDAKQLDMDAVRASCDPMLAGVPHTNAKKWHWKVLDCRALGLRPAVEDAGIEWAGQYHPGIDDARILALLTAAMLGSSENPDLEPF